MLLVLIVAIVIYADLYSYKFDLPYYNFVSVEQHVERLTKRTEEKYAKELADGTIVGFKVDLMYDNKDNPRYFIIELEYKDPILRSYDRMTNENTIDETIYYETNFVFFTGIITFFGYEYKRCYDTHLLINPFSSTGNFEKKKYDLGNVFAIEDNGEIKKVVDYGCTHIKYASSIERTLNICNECYGETITDINDDKYCITNYHYTKFLYPYKY